LVPNITLAEFVPVTTKAKATAFLPDI